MKVLGFHVQSFGTKPKSSLCHTRTLLAKARVIREMWGEEVGVYEL